MGTRIARFLSRRELARGRLGLVRPDPGPGHRAGRRVRGPAIHRAAVPLDRYSFPSGHTLHATSFAVMGSHYLPELALPLAGFAVLVAFSRVVLGLHYPTDVAAGALLGVGLAKASLGIAAVLAC